VRESGSEVSDELCFSSSIVLPWRRNLSRVSPERNASNRQFSVVRQKRDQRPRENQYLGSCKLVWSSHQMHQQMQHQHHQSLTTASSSAWARTGLPSSPPSPREASGYIHTYVLLHVHAHAHTHTHTHTHMTHLHITHTYNHLGSWESSSSAPCMRRYTYTYAYTYVHLHIHIYA
jgi:hypothetical protein